MRSNIPADDAPLGVWRRALIVALADFPAPVAEADGLLGGVLGLSRTGVHARLNEPTGALNARRLVNGLERRLRHEPLQYITGRCDFMGLDLIVESGCLVPRPETEFLVAAVLERFAGGTFLDWGTGTGCIALSILAARPRARALLAEVNPQSLRCAWRNLRRFGMTSRALLWHSRTPEDIPGGQLDLVVSNPPYIRSATVPGLMPEVSVWEPRQALDGGSDGLTPYGPLMELARRHLRPGGLLAVEFGGAEQVEPLRTLAYGFDELLCGLDLSGIPRFFIWQNPQA